MGVEGERGGLFDEESASCVFGVWPHKKIRVAAPQTRQTPDSQTLKETSSGDVFRVSRARSNVLSHLAESSINQWVERERISHDVPI